MTVIYESMPSFGCLSSPGTPVKAEPFGRGDTPAAALTDAPGDDARWAGTDGTAP